MFIVRTYVHSLYRVCSKLDEKTVVAPIINAVIPIVSGILRVAGGTKQTNEANFLFPSLIFLLFYLFLDQFTLSFFTIKGKEKKGEM